VPWFAEQLETHAVEIVNDAGDKAVVTCRRLNAGDHAAVVDKMMDDEAGEGEVRIELVKRAVVSWTLTDAEGNLVPYSEAMLLGLAPEYFLQIYAGLKKEDVNPFMRAAALSASLKVAAADTPPTGTSAPAASVADAGESPTSSASSSPGD
jgi:hypothetical protein